MQSLSLFPILSDELIMKLRIQSTPYSLFYLDENEEEQSLTTEDTGSTVHPIIDDNGRWTPDLYGFGFRKQYTINCPTFLFGNRGVACSDAVLSLALIWKSPDSRQRSAEIIGHIDNNNIQQSFNLYKFFNKPRFKGKLELQTAIVINTAGNPHNGEEHLANIPGTVLGVIDNYTIEFDGTGSAFPIMVVNNPEGLLWSVDCSFDDPLTDKFTDCVAINLNSAHKDYKYIDSNDRNYNPSFLREILAEALTTIVNYIREGEFWNDIKNGKSEDESVGQAVAYFADTLGLNLDDAKQCSVAFRDYFEKKLGEI